MSRVSNILAASCLLFAALAGAQENSPTVEINQAWQIRQKLQTAGDSLVEPQLQALLALQKKYGLDALQSIAGLLLDEVREGRGDALTDEGKIAYARLFAGGSSVVDHFLCRRGFSLAAAHACAAAFAADLGAREGRSRVLANAASAAVSGITLLAALLAALAWLRHASESALYAEYRYPHFPRSALVVAALGLAAVAWFLGRWIGLAWFSIALLHRFLSAQEKIAFGSILAAALALPFAFDRHAERLHYETSLAPLLETPFDDYDLATRAATLENHVRAHPKDEFAYLTLGRIAERLGDRAGAEERFGQAAAAAPKWATPWVNLAVSQRARGETALSIESLKKAAQIDPASLYAQFNLGKALIRETRLEEAQAALKRAKGIDSARFEELERRSKALGDGAILEAGLDAAEIDAVLAPGLAAQRRSIAHAMFVSRFPGISLPLYIAVNLAFLALLALTGRAFALPPAFVHILRQSSTEPAHEADILNPLAAKSTLQGFDFFGSLVRRIKNAWITFVIPGGPLYFQGHALGCLAILAVCAALLAPLFSVGTALQPPFAVLIGMDDPWPYAGLGAFFALYAALAYRWVKHGA